MKLHILYSYPLHNRICFTNQVKSMSLLLILHVLQPIKYLFICIFYRIINANLKVSFFESINEVTLSTSFDYHLALSVVQFFTTFPEVFLFFIIKLSENLFLDEVQIFFTYFSLHGFFFDLK